MLYIIIHSQNQITKLFIAPSKACHYVELEPVQTQNAKISGTSLKRSNYLEKESF